MGDDVMRKLTLPEWAAVAEDEYFRERTRRNVTREQWEEWKWGWPSGNFKAQVEKALDH